MIKQIKRKNIPKGYNFKGFSFAPEEKLTELTGQEKYVIPLKQGFGKKVPFILNIGDTVSAGQILGINDNTISNPVHSPVDGIVESQITDENGEVNSVIIKSSGSSKWKPLPSCNSDWSSIPKKILEELIYKSGAGALDLDGIPTAYKSSSILPENVKHIIVNGNDSGVYNFSNNILLNGDGCFFFLEGLKILNKIMPDASVHVALNKDEKKLNKKIIEDVSKIDWIKTYKLNSRYPQGKQEILISSILNMRYPYKTSSTGIGAIVLSLQTILHIYEAVCLGKPVLERIVALCGSGFKENIYLKVKIGTTIGDILKSYSSSDLKQRLIRNNLLNGNVILKNDTPVDRTFNKLIAIPEETSRQFVAFARPGLRKDSFSNTFLSVLKKDCNTNMRGEQRPCVFCNYCDSVCPVNILPFLISKYIERDLIDESIINLKIFDCVDCNLCTYVCPSKIPIAENIKKGKQKILSQSSLFPSLKTINVDMDAINHYEEIK